MAGWLAVALGGAAGSALRYGVNQLLSNNEGFYATAAVNIVGSVVLGFIAGASFGSDTTRLLVTVGVLGGFTTFSTWSVETAALLQDGRVGTALANVLLPTVLGVLGAWIGLRTA